MTTPLDYFNFGLGILSALLTLGTFITSIQVKKKINHVRERDGFFQERPSIIGELEGFINSINTDKLQNSDPRGILKSQISQYCTNLKTKYTFFSFKTKRTLSRLETQLLYDNVNWDTIAKSLITLKNYVNKEL